MIIKRILIIVCLIVYSFSFSQNKDYHIIELLPIEKDTVAQVDFFVSKIIDNRIYKNNLGIAQKGVFNRKVLSKFDKPFEESLQEYINIIFPVEANKQAIVLRINQLLISENTGAFKETGKVIVNLDVLIERSEGTFLVGSFSAYAEKNSMDVTKKHDDRIRTVLKDCLIQFSLSDWKVKEGRAIVTDVPQYPVILKKKFKKGFFTSFIELYSNKPFEDSLIKFKENKHRPNKLFLKKRDDKRALYYAYSNGNNIYINAANYSGEKHFVKTELVNKYLLLNDAFVHQDKAIGMSMAFGVLGILASNKQTHVLLDLYNGQYYVIDHYKIRLLLKDDYPDKYKKIRKNPNDITLMKSVLEDLFNEKDSNEIINILEN